jgi:hypothetical protein
MDVRSTGSLSAPVLALGIFLAERRGAFASFLAQTFKTSSGIPHTDRPTSGL